MTLHHNDTWEPLQDRRESLQTTIDLFSISWTNLMQQAYLPYFFGMNGTRQHVLYLYAFISRCYEPIVFWLLLSHAITHNFQHHNLLMLLQYAVTRLD